MWSVTTLGEAGGTGPVREAGDAGGEAGHAGALREAGGVRALGRTMPREAGDAGAPGEAGGAAALREAMPGEAGGEATLAQIDAIFFEAAATRNFASDAERAAYRDLWLGRYIRHSPEAFLLARGPDGAVVGYLAGALVSNREPLPGPDYYDAFPVALIDAFPAHLHINVRLDHRGRAVGRALIEAFRALCRAHGAAGFHAVTLADSRPAAFFTRCGLDQRATAAWRGRRLAFLAAPLGG